MIPKFPYNIACSNKVYKYVFTIVLIKQRNIEEKLYMKDWIELVHFYALDYNNQFIIMRLSTVLEN